MTCHRPIRITPVQTAEKDRLEGTISVFGSVLVHTTLNTHPRLTSNLLIRKVFSTNSGYPVRPGTADGTGSKTCYTAVHTVKDIHQPPVENILS